jgi:hypothetical protein
VNGHPCGAIPESVAVLEQMSKDTKATLGRIETGLTEKPGEMRQLGGDLRGEMQ